MISLRSRLAYLRMFFTTVVVVASEAYKLRVIFSKAIYIIAKYCIDDRFGHESKTSASFPQFQTLIVVVSQDYIGLL